MVTITRRDIIFKNYIVIIILAIAIFSLIALWVPTLFRPLDATELKETKNVSLLLVASFFIISAFITIPAYFKVRNMEKALNIDFDSEMSKLGVKDFNYMDNTWFIVSYSFIVNRDYIKEITKVSRTLSESTYQYNYKVKTITGKTVKYTDLEDSNRFQSWFEHDNWYKK